MSGCICRCATTAPSTAAWCRTPAAAALGSATLAAGGTYWWRQRGSEAATVAQAPDADLAPFWATPWVDPQGNALNVQQFQGKPLLINFWATWCPPCIEELPLLDAFYKENKSNGWQVLGIAVDKPSPVQAFLARQPLSFPVVMAGMDGVALSKSLGNTAGGLPFSVLLGPDGQLRERKIGKLSPADLAQWRQLR